MSFGIFLIRFFQPFDLQLSFRMPDPQVDIDTIKEITDMFIEAGIHMDAVNVEGLTAAQICTSRKYQWLNMFIFNIQQTLSLIKFHLYENFSYQSFFFFLFFCLFFS